jgi:hypothetical protein
VDGLDARALVDTVLATGGTLLDAMSALTEVGHQPTAEDLREAVRGRLEERFTPPDDSQFLGVLGRCKHDHIPYFREDFLPHAVAYAKASAKKEHKGQKNRNTNAASPRVSDLTGALAEIADRDPELANQTLASLANVKVKGNLDLRGDWVKELPRGLTIKGRLSIYFSEKSRSWSNDQEGLGTSSLEALPDHLVAESVNLGRCPNLKAIGKGLQTKHLSLWGSEVLVDLPDDLQIAEGGSLSVVRCRALTAIPKGLTCAVLDLHGCVSLQEIPDGTRASEKLNLSECVGLERIGAGVLANELNVEGCRALKEIPADLEGRSDLLAQGCSVLEAVPTNRRYRVDLRACPALRELPEGFAAGKLILKGNLALQGLPNNLAISDLDIQDKDIPWGGVIPAGAAVKMVRTPGNPEGMSKDAWNELLSGTPNAGVLVADLLRCVKRERDPKLWASLMTRTQEALGAEVVLREAAAQLRNDPDHEADGFSDLAILAAAMMRVTGDAETCRRILAEQGVTPADFVALNHRSSRMAAFLVGACCPTDAALAWYKEHDSYF